jgi:hypothetical protein
MQAFRALVGFGGKSGGHPPRPRSGATAPKNLQMQAVACHKNIGTYVLVIEEYT